MLALSVAISTQMNSVADAWKFLITFAGGAGVTWILRWFWWRVNAYTEISAMLASGIIATYVSHAYSDWPLSYKLWSTVGGSALIWLPVTLLSAPASRNTLYEFVHRVNPGKIGWSNIYAELSKDPPRYLSAALLGWLGAVLALFSGNFAIGAALLGRWTLCLSLSSLCVIVCILWRTRWQRLLEPQSLMKQEDQTQEETDTP